MKKVLFAVAVVFLAEMACTHSTLQLHRGSGSHHKAITVFATAVAGSSALVDFPLFVSIQNDPELRSTTNGGGVADAGGADLFFTQDASALDFEIVSYSSSSGSLVAWVKIPSLAPGVESIVDLNYGNTVTPANAPDAVWPGYQGVWHLADDLSANPAQIRDSTLNSNFGIAMGGMTAANSVPGITGPALSFDGVSNVVDFGDPASGILDFSANDSFSFSLWVNARAGVGQYDQAWFKGGSSSGTPGYDVELGTTQWRGHVSDGAGEYSCTFGDESAFLQTWTYLAVVVERTANRFQCYANGALADSVGLGTAGAIQATAHASIGGDTSLSNPYHGLIDEVRVGPAFSGPRFLTEYQNITAPAAFLTVGAQDAP